MDSERFMADQRRACKATSRRPGEAASISRWELASVRASIITRFAWWLAHFSAHTSDFVIGVVTHLTNCLLMGLGDWVWAPPMPLPSQPAGTAQNCERELCVAKSAFLCLHAGYRPIYCSARTVYYAGGVGGSSDLPKYTIQAIIQPLCAPAE